MINPLRIGSQLRVNHSHLYTTIDMTTRSGRRDHNKRGEVLKIILDILTPNYSGFKLISENSTPSTLATFLGGDSTFSTTHLFASHLNCYYHLCV